MAGEAPSGILLEARLNFSSALASPRGFFDTLASVSSARYSMDREIADYMSIAAIGAIGSSVAHDSHNIVSVGVDDIDICRAVNTIIKEKGGISAVCGDTEKVLPLPVAGIMSDLSYKEVSKRYIELDRFAKELGSQLRAPFMSLSFMALLVIPQIKLSDKGLFDVLRFEFVDLFAP